MAGGFLKRFQGWFNSQQPELAAPGDTLPSASREARIQLVDQLRDQGKLADAALAIERLESEFPNDGAIFIRMGIVRYMQGRFLEAKRYLEKTLAIDTDVGIAHKFLAASSMQLGDPLGAISSAKRAVVLLPEDAELQNMLGAFHVHVEEYAEAAPYFLRALKLDPSNLTPLLNFHRQQIQFGGVVDLRKYSEEIEPLREEVVSTLATDLRSGEFDVAEAELLMFLTNGLQHGMAIAAEVTDIFSDRTDVSPGLALMMSAYFWTVGNLEQAKKQAERAYALDPDAFGPWNNLGNALIAEGGERWHEGWKLCRAAWDKIHPHAYVTEVPRWNGEGLQGRRLLIYQEQGFGDALLALRFVPMLAERGIRVVLSVRAPIADLARSIGGYEEFHSSEFRPDPRALGCAVACPLLDLVHVLSLTRSDIKRPPILSVPEARRAIWRERLSALTGVRIGLALAGNSGRQDDWLRTLPSAALGPLTSLSGIAWVNLAVDKRAETDCAIDMLSMTDPTGELKDFTDTAAMIDALDAVIAIDCSAAHVAASLGKPVWVLAPSLLDWRWQIGDDLAPWWPTSHVFRAEAPGEWTKAMARLVEEIQIFVRTRSGQTLSDPIASSS